MCSHLHPFPQVMDAVSRGSELHTFMTAKVLFRELRAVAVRRKDQREAGGTDDDGGGGPGSAEDVESATMDIQLAHVARYGRLPTGTFLKLIRISEKVGKAYT